MIKSIEGNNKVNDQRKKIHPHKFTLWVALGSIIMMFAGLTSAYIVKKGCSGMDELRHTARLLVFDGRDPGKQPDRADGARSF